MTDHYETLGVDKNATQEEIKKAHRKKVRKAHPDTGGDSEKFMLIQRAYEILSDEDKRRRYDNGETDPGNIIHEAFNYVAGMFKSLVDGADERLICIDVIGKMTGLAANDKLSTEKRIAAAEEKIVFLGQVKKRLSHKGTRQNILSDILDYQIRNLRSGIKSAEHQVEVLNLAAQIIREYSFEPESPMTSERARDNFEGRFSRGGPFSGIVIF